MTNQRRTDTYIGSIENHSWFTLEIIDAVPKVTEAYRVGMMENLSRCIELQLVTCWNDKRSRWSLGRCNIFTNYHTVHHVSLGSRMLIVVQTHPTDYIPGYYVEDISNALFEWF
ncbi:hypothetical protein BDQ17DRAFT_1452927 [Cyathus striatus]|nr:hypothetical protein BDQ17DRAFT_1452927 [Cyathus striatus]